MYSINRGVVYFLIAQVLISTISSQNTSFVASIQVRVV